MTAPTPRLQSTNVSGTNYGTHIDGENGRTLCKRYRLEAVNRVGAGQEDQASCKLCQRARLQHPPTGPKE